MFWAQALAGQDEDPTLAERFEPIARELASKAEAIVSELNQVQGKPMDINGYFQPCPEKAAEAMRPCTELNSIIEGITAHSHS